MRIVVNSRLVEWPRARFRRGHHPHILPSSTLHPSHHRLVPITLSRHLGQPCPTLASVGQPSHAATSANFLTSENETASRALGRETGGPSTAVHGTCGGSHLRPYHRSERHLVRHQQHLEMRGPAINSGSGLATRRKSGRDAVSHLHLIFSDTAVRDEEVYKMGRRGDELTHSPSSSRSSRYR
jgi:hypothetical protein